MISGDREGPEIIPAHTIPVPERTSCYGCKYFENNLRSHSFFEGSVYSYTCSHEDAYDTPHMKDFGDREISRDGSGFGHTDSTPTWCPFLREKDLT